MDIELVTPSQINLDLDVLEDGLTYAENATKKAIAFAKASNLISLADDSGLEVDALDGAPGLYSARYGSTNGEKLSDADRRKYLLSKLQDQPRPWTARFHATIAIAIPKLWSPTDLLSDMKEQVPAIHLAVGICEGEIIPAERGTGGFGYDPIFLLPELGRTMSELSMDEKNRLSHRAKAVMNAKDILKTLFAN
jgi:XTP/dITP diphosphohydrolase